MVYVPCSLMHPGVCPVSVKVPEPDAMPIAILPCMVMVLVPALLGAVQDTVIVIAPPFIIPCPISPLITLPVPKHWSSEPRLAKFILVHVREVLFCIMVKVNEPNCCPAG